VFTVCMSRKSDYASRLGIYLPAKSSYIVLHVCLMCVCAYLCMCMHKTNRHMSVPMPVPVPVRASPVLSIPSQPIPVSLCMYLYAGM